MFRVRSFKAFGKGYEILCDVPVDSEWLDLMLPGFADSGPSSEDRHSLSIVTNGREESRGLYYGNERLCTFDGFNEETARGFEGNIEFVLARNAAPEFVFVHAGAVSLEGIGIVFPSKTGSGKTTLTRALLELGAEYFSDDCAVIDSQGMLYPMASPMKLRTESGKRSWLDPARAGYSKSEEPVKVGCVLLTDFEQGTRFDPSAITPGEASLGILENLFLPSVIRDCPAETLAAIGRAVEGSLLLKGTRGEAIETANVLRSRLS
ncbi:MAG TPA: hypothetical protein VMM38_12800 [Aridibacter sp.]|nr:hypothetical protein [Aridibacter sp.]